MARIAGINIPDRKHAWVSLTSIYGIGQTKARAICKDAGIDPRVLVKDLTEEELDNVRTQVSRYWDVRFHHENRPLAETHARMREIFLCWWSCIFDNTLSRASTALLM